MSLSPSNQSNKVQHRPLVLLDIPQKKCERVDFNAALSFAITEHFGQDPAKFNAAIQQFQDLRDQALIEKSMDLEGRDKLYKYYSQLELFEAHFSSTMWQDSESSSDGYSTNHAGISLKFKWYDAFWPKDSMVEQSSTAFEKAGLLYNLAAITSYLASKQNRNDESGVKTAYNSFQASAGILGYIHENFLHAPTKDLGKECLGCLIDLQLAQAQECFIDKSLSSNDKKLSILVKVINQCSKSYENITQLASSEKPLKGYIPSTWVSIFKIKAKYYGSLANYFRSILAEEEGKYGEIVARLRLSSLFSNDAVQLADEMKIDTNPFLLSLFSKNKQDKRGSQYFDGVPSIETTKSFLKEYNLQINACLASAEKDNDVVYNEPVPAGASLQPLASLFVPKSIKLTELNPDLLSKAGPDLFQDLIPLSVAEKESLYSSKKDDFVRELTHMIRLAEEQGSTVIASSGILDMLNLLESSGDMTEVPHEAIEWANSIYQSEKTQKLEEAFAELTNISDGTRQFIETCSKYLNDDHHAFQRAKMMQSSSQYGIAQYESLVQKLNGELEKIRSNYGKGVEGDRALAEKYYKIIDNVKSLSGRPESALKSMYLNASNGGEVIEKKVGDISLIDMPVPKPKKEGILQQASENDLNLYKACKDLLQRIDIMRSAREEILFNLREKVKSDDIHQILVHSKGKEDAVIENELRKFQTYKTEAQKNIHEEQRLMSELKDSYLKLCDSPLALKVKSSSEARVKITNQIRNTKTEYQSVRENLGRGIKYHKSLNAMAQKFYEQLHQSLFIFQQKRTPNSIPYNQ